MQLSPYHVLDQYTHAAPFDPFALPDPPDDEDEDAPGGIDWRSLATCLDDES
jgi:hypothetical protein